MSTATRNGRNRMKKRIAPGIWEDLDGNIHWSIAELLMLVDLPDTPENREAVTAMLRQQMRAINPQAMIVERARCPACGAKGANHKSGCKFFNGTL
jgi:hypothetical protein